MYVVVEKGWIVFLSRFDFQEGDLWQFVGHVKKANSSCMQMELSEFLDMIFSWPPINFPRSSVSWSTLLSTCVILDGSEP